MALNSRAWFVYRSDDGNDYLVQLDASNGDVAGAGLARAVSPANDATPQLPRRLRPRFVWAENISNGGRRRIVCGQPDAALFQDGGTVTLDEVGDADGAPYTCTGAVGEKRVFGLLPTGTP